MSYTVNIVRIISEALGRIAQAVEVYLKTREAAYRRGMDKKLRKALNAAEQFILRYRELYPTESDKELRKWEKLFWRYNN